MSSAGNKGGQATFPLRFLRSCWWFSDQKSCLSPFFVIAMLFFLAPIVRSEEHTSELQSRLPLVCRLLLEKKRECAGACARGPSRGSAARLWPDLSVREPRPLADVPEFRVVVRPERLHVVRRHEPPVRRLVLELVHRHVPVGILALERPVAPRAHQPFELQDLGHVLLVVPAVE